MMENIDNIYNNLLIKLRDTKPEIGDPNALTDSIMNSLHKTSGSNIKRIIRWTRPVVTIAALFLFGLFILQQLDKTKVLQVSSLVYIENLKPITIPANCFEENKQKGIINKSPLSMYLCYIKQTELAKKKANLLLMNQILKYQIKSSK
jgi:hypothetical protein